MNKQPHLHHKAVTAAGCATPVRGNSQHTHGGHNSLQLSLPFPSSSVGSHSPSVCFSDSRGLFQLLPDAALCSQRSCCSHLMILHVEPVSDQTFNLEGEAKENSGELNYLLLHTIIWHNTARK